MEELQIVSAEEQKQTKLLENGLVMADRFINKNYLINMQEREIVPISEYEKNTGALRLFKVKKLVYDKKENVNDKLISVYSALQDIEGTALMIVDSDGKRISYYIGVRTAENAATASLIMEKSFMGNFSGSELHGLKNSEIAEVMSHITESQFVNTPRNVAEVTVVPSPRDEDKEKFVQGIEKFIDTMQGEKYTAVFIAHPLSKNELETQKRGYEELYSALSPFAKTTLAYGENYSKAVSKGMFQNFSHSVNNSISNTNGGNEGTNSSYTQGSNWGSSSNWGGFGSSSGSSSSSTTGYSSGKSWSTAVTSGSADTTAEGTQSGESETTGDSRTLTLEHHNKAVEALLEKIEAQLKRIHQCEAFGVWDCAGFFVADDIQTAVVAANTYKALMLGDETYVENSFVNVWGLKNEGMTKRVLDYIQYGMQPRIAIRPEAGFTGQLVTPGNFISGKELPLMMGIPHKSVTGLTVSSIAEFGRNVFIQNKRGERRQIRLGRVHHMGRTEASTVKLDLDSFTSHCFITGSTGSGKSNTTYCLLEKFMENNVPFLVIEPAKGEYKDAFGAVPGIHVFSTNPRIGEMLKINPFRFDPNIHVLEHLDRLIEIFNACWEMYAAMPAILKDAVEKAYIAKGWDLLNSVYMNEGEPEYPTFMDLLEILPKVIQNSGYSSDTQGDYTGALVTRVSSLANGISGQIFCDCYDVPDSILFDENVVVDLSRVGAAETKSLIMGVLVLKLSEYRMANADEANSGLRHITVMEEAHNLLKRTSGEGAGGSTVIGKSVEMICSSIAEMRTYGEGFVIVDQSPTAVDIAAIKNTNTKIIMRLPEEKDCEAVGNAVGLDEEQQKEIAKLGTGIAVVMQNNWLEAVLTHIDAFSNKYEKKFTMVKPVDMKRLRGAVIGELAVQYIEKRQMDYSRMEALIDSQNVLPEKKAEMKNCMQAVIGRLSKGRDIKFFCKTLMNVSSCRNLFDILEKDILSERGSDGIHYDRDNILEWRESFVDQLGRYIELPQSVREALFQYLLFAKTLEKTIVDYGAIYDLLY